MGKIHILSEAVANKISAGEVVERPASVVKELLENSLDAGATRIKINIEAGGKKLIQIVDNGCGMVRDDAMLAFERHATSKLKDADDLLKVATLGFRGEALPSIASVSRLRLETRAAEIGKRSDSAKAASNGSSASSGTVIEINGGKMARVEEAGLPEGTSITVRDLFFNTPARKKFLKAESTELSHIASLVTHYALAHPEKHFELHSATNAMLVAPPVAGHSERVYQIFGKETLDQLISVAATQKLERIGLPQPPPWRREKDEAELQPDESATGSAEPGEMRLHGFVSKPEIQKLNRNSIYVFVNGRLIRDRLIQHALTEAHRNIIPPTVYPVVLLFLEMPPGEVDVNVHPSKTEVRFRQSSVMHDFVRDTVRAALMKARPVPQFTMEIRAHATATPGLTPGARDWEPPSEVAAAIPSDGNSDGAASGFSLQAAQLAPVSGRFQFDGSIAVEANAAVPVARGILEHSFPQSESIPDNGCAQAIDAGEDGEEQSTLAALSTLHPLGQVRNSFILATNEEGLWIIDQHVAHERVLFERILKQRASQQVESQRLLMPIVIELSPAQQAVFAEIADELAHNGFEAEPFGARSVAIKVSPAGVDAAQVEHMLHELLDQLSREDQSLNLEKIRGRIAASIACHAAIKVNMPLEQNKMEWLLAELAKTDHPMSCPHGRPVVLRYSVKEIQKAFKRI